MKISTKGWYALRMMLEFALHPDECTKTNQVAKRQQISKKYLEQIVIILSRAGYVKSVRGAQGGYMLTKGPPEYTAGMILRLIEGGLVPVACLDADEPCGRSSICVTLDVWRQLNDAINQVVDHVTLADLAKEQLVKPGCILLQKLVYNISTGIIIMINEFSRTQLLIGEEELSKLSSSTVMVFGVGGVGSHCIETLAKCDIGRLTLINLDEVTLTNINRQSTAYYGTVGQFKTKVMKRQITDINSATQVTTFERPILPENLEQLSSEIPGTIDYVADTIDTVAAKLVLMEYCTAREIPLLTPVGAGNKLYEELPEITDISKTSVCPLCRATRRELKGRGIYHLKILYSEEEPLKPKFESGEVTSKRVVPGSTSFVPPVAGLLIAGEVVRELSGS